MTELNVNGTLHSIEVSEDKPLLWVLREDLKLRGAKYSCGRGLCGACTVLVDGQATRSCVTPVGLVADKAVRTIEGLDDTLGSALKAAWIRHRVAQCGYCQSGQIMSAYAMVNQGGPSPDVPLKQSLTNLCRCGTYNRIEAALSEVTSQQDDGA